MRKNPSILIIEDDENMRKLYAEAYAKTSFVVTILPNADGYFAEQVAEIAPDIISMDLMIGEEGGPSERDGFEAMQMLKEDLRTNEIPILVVSNFFQEDRVRHAKELGAIDYINLAGYNLEKIPKQFQKYLDNPKNYKPLHPLFRT